MFEKKERRIKQKTSKKTKQKCQINILLCKCKAKFIEKNWQNKYLSNLFNIFFL